MDDGKTPRSLDRLQTSTSPVPWTWWHTPDCVDVTSSAATHQIYRSHLRGRRGSVSKKLAWILLLIASGLALASCQNVPDAPDDCAHRTYGCDMTGRPL
jgi:hypothetical protein